MKWPQDPPFYPGSWFVGFLVLLVGWIEYGGWVGIGASLGFMFLHGLLVAIFMNRAAAGAR